MTKKEKRKLVDLAGLELRLRDMAQGAAGHCVFGDGQDEDSAGIAYEMGMPEWLRFVGAVRRSFRESGTNAAPARSVAFELWNLEHFADRFDVAAEHLYDYGARP
jgi:hypothetical protein